MYEIYIVITETSGNWLLCNLKNCDKRSDSSNSIGYGKGDH